MVAKTAFGALEKDILVNWRCHLKNPNLTWLSKWSCVLGDGSDGRRWGSGSLFITDFWKISRQLLLRWKPSFLDTGTMMNWTCFPGFQKTKFFQTLTFNIWDKCINPEEGLTWEPTVHPLRTIHISLDNLKSHPLLSREKKSTKNVSILWNMSNACKITVYVIHIKNPI